MDSPMMVAEYVACFDSTACLLSCPSWRSAYDISAMDFRDIMRHFNLTPSRLLARIYRTLQSMARRQLASKGFVFSKVRKTVKGN